MVDELTVFDIQRFCLHDGPGIRTLVFLKGCPLRCRWCQNPESMAGRPEMAFYADRCRGCMACARVCPEGAIQSGDERIGRERCQACGNCARACPHEALRLIGWHDSPEGLFARVNADRAYWDASGGGVTVTGGEPLLQANGVARLLSLCHDAGVHTLVETCGAVSWRAFEQVLPFTRCFYFDLKAAGDGLHRELTGVPSSRIFANARRLAETGAEVVFRMPVVPGLNDSAASVGSISELLDSLGCSTFRLLPYHSGGDAKLARLATSQRPLRIDRATADAAVERVGKLLRGRGKTVTVEGAPARARRGRDSSFPPRVWRLRRAVQAATPSVCAERALLVTEYARDRGNRDKPVVIQRAETLRHIARGRTAAIYEDELLVGCFSSYRVGGSIFPELHGVPVMQDLLSFRRRALNPLYVSRADAARLATRVLPFWLPRFLSVRAFPLAKTLRFVADQLGGRRFLINETGGISHFVPDYATLLRLGTSGIAAKARARADATSDRERRDFYAAVEISCAALEELAAPYAAEARAAEAREPDAARRRELLAIAGVCERVPREPARTLHEALQSLLFAQILLNQESLDNSVGPGRLDQVLAPYLHADFDAGRLDERGARDLVGCFTVKMSEIVPVFSDAITRFHGGMFNGQTVVVGGVDAAGEDVTNQLTWIFLDAMDALRMRQPNYHARLHRGSPRAYVEHAAAMLRDGSGAPSLLNDEVVVPALEARGMSREHARDYSPVGCIEPVSCGRTYGSTDAALANLALPLEWTLGSKRDGCDTGAIAACRSIDEVGERLVRQIEHLVALLVGDLQAIERANARFHPTPLTSALLEGCLESGRDASAGGALYNGSGVQGVGIADLADSLAAIEHVLFRRELFGWSRLLDALEHDFVGYDDVRGHLLRAPKYGNDDPAADRHADFVVRAFADALGRHQNTRGGRYWAGLYSVTAHRAFGETTGALPSGRRAGTPLGNGLSPANGADRLGPTAALSSVAVVDAAASARNGVNVNVRIDGGSVPAPVLADMVRGYFDRGGMQVQINAIDPAVLLEARDHPERHPWMLVRVSGYSAYFNDLSPEMKQEIIDRTVHR